MTGSAKTLAAVLALTILGGATADLAAARGKTLDGKKAPPLTFHDGLGVLETGGRLEDFQGQVVWLKFVLRDCSACRRAYPRFQQLHERWGGSGLVTLAVMHRHPAKSIAAWFESQGYTFPVGIDGDGKEAQRYGVGRRPTDYVIGHDGIVRASNGAPERVLRVELARRRVARLGRIPEPLAATKDLVWNWNYGEALRKAEPVLASEDVPAEIRTFVARLQDEAKQEVNARLASARRLRAARRVPESRALLDRLVRHFEGTTLAAGIREERTRIEALEAREKR